MLSLSTILGPPLLGIHLSNREIVIIAVVAAFAIWATSARKPGRRCSRCHELNRDQAVYCAQCGQKLARQKSP